MHSTCQVRLLEILPLPQHMRALFGKHVYHVRLLEILPLPQHMRALFGNVVQGAHEGADPQKFFCKFFVSTHATSCQAPITSEPRGY